MITTKYVNYRQVLNLSGIHLIWISIWCTLIAVLFHISLGMDDYSLGSCCFNWYQKLFWLALKTIRHMTDFGSPKNMGWNCKFQPFSRIHGLCI
jgi:hypothetical protein